MFRISLLISYIFCSQFALGQIESITIKDGLIDRNVVCIYQTHNGYMWFGTSSGLNRYDGYQLENYNELISDQSPSLSNGRITELYEDNMHRLWIGTANGLNRFDLNSGEAKVFFGPESNREFIEKQNSYIHHIVPYRDSMLFIAMRDGRIFLFDEQDHYRELHPFLDKELKSNYTIGSIAVDVNNTVFLTVSNKGIYQFNKELTSAKLIKKGSGYSTIMFSDQFSEEIMLARKTNYGFLKINTRTNQIVQDEFLDSLNKAKMGIQDLFVDNQENLWGNFRNKLIKIDIEKERVIDYTTMLKREIDGKPNYIYQDKNDMIWISQYDKVVKFIPPGEFFEHYLSTIPYNKSNHVSTRGMVEDENGEIYITSYDGLFKLDPSSGQVKDYAFKNSEGKRRYLQLLKLVNDKNNLWIVTETAGIYKFDKINEQFTMHIKYHEKNKDYSSFSYDFAEDKNGLLWIATGSGILTYDRSTNTLNSFVDTTYGNSLKSSKVKCLFYTSEGFLWAGTEDAGLFKIEGEKGIVSHLSTITDLRLSSNHILSLFEDENGVLWAGTRGGGLNRIDIKNQTIDYYTQDEGLANNTVAGIFETDSNKLWITTFFGLSMLDKKSGKIHNYYEKDGISHNEFNTNSHLKASDGSIYVGGLNGLNRFWPDELIHKGKNSKPEIYFTLFSKHDGNADQIIEKSLGLDQLKIIKLSYKDRFFSFAFSLTDYFDPSKHNYSYLLEGYDLKWNKLGNQNFVRFNGIPAGEYTLKVKAVNENGLATRNELNVKILVGQAFYSSWWFLTLVGLAIASLIHSMIQYRFRQKLKVALLRTKISSDLHDEVGSLMTRISIQSELIRQHDSLDPSIKSQLDEIAQTSRLATSTMGDVLWSIDGRNDTIYQLVDHMRELAREMLEPLSIVVDFHFDSSKKDQLISIEIRQNVFLIFKEAINNIAKYAKANQVTIALKNSKGRFIMRISDNGIGIDRSQKLGTGQGMKNMELRAKRIGGILRIENNNGLTVVFSRKSFF